MKPSESYQKLQKELLELIKAHDRTGETGRIRNRLEREFMAAWQMSGDRRRLGAKLGEAIRLFRTRRDACVRGFDHSSFYTGVNDQRIIVTQPYGTSPSEIAQDLDLGNGVHPEVIDATEWGFYYPGNAKLFIVKFPPNFQKSMDDFEKASRQAELKAALAAPKPDRAEESL